MYINKNWLIISKIIHVHILETMSSFWRSNFSPYEFFSFFSLSHIIFSCFHSGDTGSHQCQHIYHVAYLLRPTIVLDFQAQPLWKTNLLETIQGLFAVLLSLAYRYIAKLLHSELFGSALPLAIFSRVYLFLFVFSFIPSTFSCLILFFERIEHYHASNR